MFGLFSKKEIDKAAAQDFWIWFAQREKWIIETYQSNSSEVIAAIDKNLKTVFPYFKKELEFQLGFHIGKGDFFFYHLGNRHLLHDAKILKDMMPPALAHHWDFIIEK